MMDERREHPREMGELLREATRLVEVADLRGANEVLKKMNGRKPATVSRDTKPAFVFDEEEGMHIERESGEVADDIKVFRNRT